MINGYINIIIFILALVKVYFIYEAYWCFDLGSDTMFYPLLAFMLSEQGSISFRKVDTDRDV